MQSILIGKGDSAAPFPVPESNGAGGMLKLAIAYEVRHKKEQTFEIFSTS